MEINENKFFTRNQTEEVAIIQSIGNNSTARNA